MKRNKSFKFALTSILVICIMVVFGVCAVAISNTATEQAAVSQSSEVTATIKTPFVITFVHDTPEVFGKIKGVMFIGTKVVVKEQKGTFWLVENKDELKGYVFKSWVNTDKKNFNREYDHIYVGETNATSSGKPRAYFRYNGDGKVRYYTYDTDIISVDSETGVVTAKKAGTATLYARVGIKTESIPIYCVYKWKKPWTGETNTSTTIYVGPSSSTTKVFTVPYNWNFYVEGDDGTDDGWVYGYSIYNKEEHWGFVKINNISTKGTISQYNNMGWSWPVVTPVGKTEANFVQSPYGRRNTDPIMHKGFDITTGNAGEINEYKVISAFAGEVIYISTSSSKSTGYCVGIKSNKTDPVTGENMVAFYMHLKFPPSVHRGQKVSEGDLLGYVGNTGNSRGYHLHFEVNNKNASIGDGSTARQYYAYLINPIYFFMNKTLRINYNSDAETEYYGTYWYGKD